MGLEPRRAFREMDPVKEIRKTGHVSPLAKESFLSSWVCRPPCR
jgi:hypothetical protein